MPKLPPPPPAAPIIKPLPVPDPVKPPEEVKEPDEKPEVKVKKSKAASLGIRQESAAQQFKPITPPKTGSGYNE
jgi:hypothetical protein